MSQVEQVETKLREECAKGDTTNKGQKQTKFPLALLCHLKGLEDIEQVLPSWDMSSYQDFAGLPPQSSMLPASQGASGWVPAFP